MMKLRAAWCFLFALFHETIFYTTVWLLGWVIVPIALLFTRKEQSLVNPQITIENLPKLFWLWGNDEDGVLPDWWNDFRKTLGWGEYRAKLVWMCWRNPVNNLRFIKPIYTPPILGEVKSHTFSNGWTMVWQGWRTRLIGPNYNLTIGFKYEPWDVNEQCEDWRRFGVGFGIRKVGKIF